MLSHPLRAAAGYVAPSTGITIVASATATGTNGTTLVVNKPTGTLSGDLLLLFITSTSNTVGTPSASGFTMLLDVDAPVSSVLYKVAGGSEPSTYSVSSGQTQPAICLLVAIRGSTNTLTSGTWSSSGTGTTITAPSITMPNSGLLFAFYGMRVSQTASMSLSTPSGMNVTLSSVSANTSSGKNYIGVYDQSVTSGSTGNKVSTVTVTSGTITYHRSVLVGIT